MQKQEAVEEENIQPDISKIRSICELATLECYYHNVAKSVKKKGNGIVSIGEKDREFWIEYDGIVKLGIDMSKVKMKLDERTIMITIPDAEVLSVSVDSSSYTSQSFIMEKDSWNKNEITAEDATLAVKEASEDMKRVAQDNASLLVTAQDRAKTMIENYIEQIGDFIGVDYDIRWVYDTDVAANTDYLIDEMQDNEEETK